MLSHQVDPPRLADQDRYSSSINLLMTRFQLFYHFFLLLLLLLFLLTFIIIFGRVLYGDVSAAF